MDTKQRFVYLELLRKEKVWFPSLLIVGVILLFTESSIRNDFDIFLAASSAMFNGKNIYLETFFDGYHYYYSTFFALILLPLTMLPVMVAKSIWILLNLAFLARTIYLTDQWLKSALWKPLFRTIVLTVTVLMCLRLIKGNIHLGQMTICMLFLSLESVHQSNRGKHILSAFLLSLAINIKILPIVLIPLLVYRAQYRVVLFSILCFLVMLFLPGLFIGMEQNFYLTAEWWNLLNPLQHKHMLDVEETSFHGLSTIIPIFLMEETGDRSSIDISRNVLSLSYEQVKWVIHIARLSLLLFTLWFLRSRPFTKNVDPIHRWWELSYILLCVPLIFPHQQHYAFLFMWPALAYLVAFSLEQQSRGQRYLFRFLLLILIFIAMNASLLMGFWRNYFEHFKILSFAALVLIPLLAFSRPSQLKIQLVN